MNKNVKSLIMKGLKIDESWIIAEGEDLLLAFVEGDYNHYRVTLAKDNRSWGPSTTHLIQMAINSRKVIGNDKFTECMEKIFKFEGDPRNGEIRQKIIEIANYYVSSENYLKNILPGNFTITFYRYCTILYSVLYSDQKRKDPDPIIIKTKSLIDGKDEFIYKHLCGPESVFGKLVTMDAIRRTRYIDEIVDKIENTDINPAQSINLLYKRKEKETYPLYVERIGDLICETIVRMKNENIL